MLARLRRIKPTTACIAALVLACAPPAWGQDSTDAQPLTECEVIARVNSEVILACELDWQVRLALQQQLGPNFNEAVLQSPQAKEFRENMLRSLILGRIEIALLYADFRSNAPQADIASIKKQLAPMFEKDEVTKLMQSVGAEDRAELEEKLIELGTSLNERREDFYRTMIARSWLTQSVKVDKEVTHEQMLEFYHSHEENYAEPERVRWEELMVRFDEHPSKSEAYAALARLGNQAWAAASSTPAGEPAFAAIAQQHSDGFTADKGGAHDWTTRGSLASGTIDEALFSQPPGEMSGILEGPVGFHIVRVLEHQDAGLTPFRDVQAKIRVDLSNERFNKTIDTKITELKQSARLWTVFTGDLTYDRLAELRPDAARR